MKIDAERILYTNYVKYDRLTDIVNTAFANSTSDKLNIYIDLYSVFKSLYNENISIVDYNVVTACIINMCAHYREFFKTRYRTYTYFYLINSKNCNIINKKFYPNYNKKNEDMFNSNRLIDDMINSNIKLLNLLCPYLTDIYFINGSFETGVIINNIIMRNNTTNNTVPHLIITKDKYNYQLTQIPNAVILRPKKGNGGDTSFFLNSLNTVNIYLKERKNKYNPSIIINPGLYSFLLSLSGCNDRYIKHFYNTTKSIKLIEKSILNYKMINGYTYSLEDSFNSILDQTLDPNLNFGVFKSRFNSIDIPFMSNIFLNTPECISMKFENLYDPETVKTISNKYFIKYPLHLNEL